MLSMPGKILSRRHIEIVFFSFFQKTGFDISCIFLQTNLHEMSDPICWDNKNVITLSSFGDNQFSKSCFLRKIRKNIISLSSIEDNLHKMSDPFFFFFFCKK